jgi:hypothetical protein
MQPRRGEINKNKMANNTLTQNNAAPMGLKKSCNTKFYDDFAPMGLICTIGNHLEYHLYLLTEEIIRIV